MQVGTTGCSCSSHPDGCGGRDKPGPTSTATLPNPTYPTLPRLWPLLLVEHSFQRAKFPCQDHLTPCASAQSATSLQGQGVRTLRTQGGRHLNVPFRTQLREVGFPERVGTKTPTSSNLFMRVWWTHTLRPIWEWPAEPSFSQGRSLPATQLHRFIVYQFVSNF